MSLRILLQHAPATSELILVNLSTRKTPLKNTEWINPVPSGSVLTAAATFTSAATFVVTRVAVTVVSPVTLRSFMLMEVSSVLGTSTDP
jgi:hypothetical protein